MLGLVGAPLAWGLQFVVIYAFASQLCMVQSPSWLPWLLPAVNLAGLVGAALALRALLLTPAQDPPGARRSSGQHDGRR